MHGVPTDCSVGCLYPLMLPLVHALFQLKESMNAMTLGGARFRLEDSIMTTLRSNANQPWPSLLLDDKVVNKMFAKLTVSAELAFTEIFRRYDMCSHLLTPIWKLSCWVHCRLMD